MLNFLLLSLCDTNIDAGTQYLKIAYFYTASTSPVNKMLNSMRTLKTLLLKFFSVLLWLSCYCVLAEAQSSVSIEIFSRLRFN